MDQPPVFTCQSCKHPLRIDESLADLSSASVDLLLAPLPEENTSTSLISGKTDIKSSEKIDFNDIEEDNGLPLSKRNQRTGSFSKNSSGLSRSPIGGISNKESFLASESYVMLPRSQVASHSNNNLSTERGSLDGNVDDRKKADWSYRIKIANRLFDIMSSRSEIEHPMCYECTDMLVDKLKKQLSDASKERDCYIDFLKKVNGSVISDTEKEDLQKEIQEIKSNELTAIKKLKDIEHESDELKKELAALEEEEKELDKLEESYWQEFNDFHIQIQTFQNERDSVNLKYDHDAKQLEKLQKTNVYNDTFCIGLDGHFGTINGFRLGRLPNIQVEWSEINAAWGQTLLLLSTIANKLNFTFQTYRLVPLGSFSRIEKIDGDVKYELYGSGDFNLKTPFLIGRFNNGMVAYLNCLQQLGDYAERQDHKLKLPYRINRDKIGDISIRFKSDETWTKALRFTLTNTKWILAYASSTNHDWGNKQKKIV
ncbi:beclin-1 [Glomus cerebriforme]|uniref:Beclin-1 n=1 Tax=Glomus cerebriforme TaxID=658196 RepID=A0A397S4E7_9GLOM|nr:beclin-1 [Glomus cerebriforme]